MPPGAALARLAEYVLRGYGQLFLANRVTSGACFACALLLVAPVAGMLSLVGAVTLTATAMARSTPESLLKTGLFGVNGVLVGYAWALFPEVDGWIPSVATAVLVWVPSRLAMLVSMAVFGAGFAAADTMVAKVIPDVFGMRAIGAIMGVLNFGWRLGAALAPAAAGFLFDRTGSYTVAFSVAPFVVLLAWVFFALGTSRVRLT